ncbi:MAG: HAD-IIIA family hydrolase [Flavobacteriales bacterium]
MKALILAGGKGTRMGNISSEIPKPMIEIGGKPIVQHQVELLKKYGITDIYFTVGHLKEKIKDFIGDGSKFGISPFFYEETKPLGTVGAVKELENELTEDFLVLYGDVMMNVNLQFLISYHKEKNSDCTLVLHPNNHPYDSDLVEIDDTGKVIATHNKPHDPDKYYRNLVNAGLYIFNPKILEFVEKGVKADFGKDIFPKIYNKVNMYGYNTPEYLKDMGTPQRLEEVEKDLKTNKIANSNLENPQKAVFLDRDGVINKEVGLLYDPKDLELFDFTAEALKKIHNSGFLSIIVTNQSVIARNQCSIEELEHIHKKLETELGDQGAMVDRIYYCPHHPHKGYPEELPEYKIDCSCRKPKPGMLEQAKREFNIDLSRSYIKNSDTQPDHYVKNLKEAAELVVN